jgi:excisionase family DNA binding protein
MIRIIELEPILVTVQEAARLMDCSRQNIYNLIKRGDLSYVDGPGTSKHLLVKDLRKWVRANVKTSAKQKVKREHET